jgi:sporulation-control protein spo0M
VTRYHKIVTNGEVRYREFNEATGFYEDETFSEEELVELLLEDAVEEVIEVDKSRIERAISTIPDRYQRETVQTYMDYIERLVGSFE